MRSAGLSYLSRQRHEEVYVAEKRTALEAWMRKVDATVSGVAAGNVVALAGETR